MAGLCIDKHLTKKVRTRAEARVLEPFYQLHTHYEPYTQQILQDPTVLQVFW